MRTHSNMDVTCTINTEDLLELCEDGELQENGVSILISGPDVEMFKKRIINEIASESDTDAPLSENHNC